MPPKGIHFTQKGKIVALGFNSSYYGIWPMDADDSNPNPISTFEKSSDGWQRASKDFNLIESGKVQLDRSQLRSKYLGVNQPMSQGIPSEVSVNYGPSSYGPYNLPPQFPDFPFRQVDSMKPGLGRPEQGNVQSSGNPNVGVGGEVSGNLIPSPTIGQNQVGSQFPPYPPNYPLHNYGNPYHQGFPPYFPYQTVLPPGMYGINQKPPSQAIKINSWAIASLILGICSIFLFSIAGVIPLTAIFTGLKSRRDIMMKSHSGIGEGGMKLAIAGAILGLISFTAFVVLVIVYAAKGQS